MAGLVLDFADAFNSIPLAVNERRFNCAHVGRNIERSRKPLFDGETQEGAFVVWRVLGFGGRPNPLVYARAASLASRSAQALLGRSSARSDLAETRLQLYVDDTVAALAGSPEGCETAVDLLVTWFLVLGVPIAWPKASLSMQPNPHRWIGIDFRLTEVGGHHAAPRCLRG